MLDVRPPDRFPAARAAARSSGRHHHRTLDLEGRARTVRHPQGTGRTDEFPNDLRLYGQQPHLPRLRITSACAENVDRPAATSRQFRGYQSAAASPVTDAHGSSPTAEAHDLRPARTPCQRTGAGKTTAQREDGPAPWTATPEINSRTSAPPEPANTPLPEFSGFTKPRLLRIVSSSTFLTLET